MHATAIQARCEHTVQRQQGLVDAVQALWYTCEREMHMWQTGNPGNRAAQNKAGPTRHRMHACAHPRRLVGIDCGVAIGKVDCGRRDVVLIVKEGFAEMACVSGG